MQTQVGHTFLLYLINRLINAAANLFAQTTRQKGWPQTLPLIF
jgi:hypothetical protein